MILNLTLEIELLKNNYGNSINRIFKAHYYNIAIVFDIFWW